MSEANKQDDKDCGSRRCSALSHFSECSDTARGFQIIEFDDANGERCELQQSSAIASGPVGLNAPGSSFLWLGVGRRAPRMHLHREHIQELIVVLRGWLADGKLDA